MAKAKRTAAPVDNDVNLPDLEEQLNEVPKVQEENPFGKKHYEEWRVELKDGKAEKLKVVRKRVLITDDQAAILNEGVLKGGNNLGNMYYPAE